MGAFGNSIGESSSGSQSVGASGLETQAALMLQRAISSGNFYSAFDNFSPVPPSNSKLTEASGGSSSKSQSLSGKTGGSVFIGGGTLVGGTPSKASSFTVAQPSSLASKTISSGALPFNIPGASTTLKSTSLSPNSLTGGKPALNAGTSLASITNSPATPAPYTQSSSSPSTEAPGGGTTISMNAIPNINLINSIHNIATVLNSAQTVSETQNNIPGMTGGLGLPSSIPSGGYAPGSWTPNGLQPTKTVTVNGKSATVPSSFSLSAALKSGSTPLIVNGQLELVNPSGVITDVYGNVISSNIPKNISMTQQQLALLKQSIFTAPNIDYSTFGNNANITNNPDGTFTLVENINGVIYSFTGTPLAGSVGQMLINAEVDMAWGGLFSVNASGNNIFSELASKIPQGAVFPTIYSDELGNFHTNYGINYAPGGVQQNFADNTTVNVALPGGVLAQVYTSPTGISSFVTGQTSAEAQNAQVTANNYTYDNGLYHYSINLASTPPANGSPQIVASSQFYNNALVPANANYSFTSGGVTYNITNPTSSPVPLSQAVATETVSLNPYSEMTAGGTTIENTSPNPAAATTSVSFAQQSPAQAATAGQYVYDIANNQFQLVHATAPSTVSAPATNTPSTEFSTSALERGAMTNSPQYIPMAYTYPSSQTNDFINDFIPQVSSEQYPIYNPPLHGTPLPNGASGYYSYADGIKRFIDGEPITSSFAQFASTGQPVAEPASGAFTQAQGQIQTYAPLLNANDTGVIQSIPAAGALGNVATSIVNTGVAALNSVKNLQSAIDQRFPLVLEAANGVAPSSPIPNLPALPNYDQYGNIVSNQLSNIGSEIYAGYSRIPVVGNLAGGIISTPFQIGGVLSNSQPPQSQRSAALGLGALYAAASPLYEGLGTIGGGLATGAGFTALGGQMSGQLPTPGQYAENTALAILIPGIAENIPFRLNALTGAGYDIYGLSLKYPRALFDRDILLNAAYSFTKHAGEEQFAEQPLINIVHSTDGWKVKLGTPSVAETFTEPTINGEGEPTSLFPATKGFTPTKTAAGESSDLLTTPFGRAILAKTINDIRNAAPVESQYAKAILDLTTALGNSAVKLPDRITLSLENLTPEENAYLSTWLKKYANDIKLLRGSVVLKMAMGEDFPREPHDIDPVFTNTETMTEAVAEAAKNLNAIAKTNKFKIDANDPGLLSLSDGGHIINAHSEEQSYAEYGKASHGKTPLGLKENAPKNVEGVNFQSPVLSMKEKLASDMSIRIISKDSLDELTKDAEKWKSFLKEKLDAAQQFEHNVAARGKNALEANKPVIEYGKLTPLHDAIARAVAYAKNSYDVYIAGSAAVRLQTLIDMFRPEHDIELYVPNIKNVADVADAVENSAAKFYKSAHQAYDITHDIVEDADGNIMQVRIFNEAGGNKVGIADVVYRNPESPESMFSTGKGHFSNEPDSVITIDGVNVRDALQVLADKEDILKNNPSVSLLKAERAIREFQYNRAINAIEKAETAPEGLTEEKLQELGNAGVGLDARIAKTLKARTDIKLINDALVQVDAKIARYKAIDDAINNLGEQEAYIATFAPSPWRVKDVLDAYITAKFLNEHNTNLLLRGKVDDILAQFKDASKQKFGLTDEDFEKPAEVDMTSLLKKEDGNANAQIIANTDKMFNALTQETSPAPATTAAPRAPNYAVARPEISTALQTTTAQNTAQSELAPYSTQENAVSGVPSYQNTSAALYNQLSATPYNTPSTAPSPYLQPNYNNPYSPISTLPYASNYQSPQYASGYAYPQEYSQPYTYTSQYQSPYAYSYPYPYPYAYPYSYTKNRYVSDFQEPAVSPPVNPMLPEKFINPRYNPAYLSSLTPVLLPSTNAAILAAFNPNLKGVELRPVLTRGEQRALKLRA